jgi:hypothetical protein
MRSVIHVQRKLAQGRTGAAQLADDIKALRKVLEAVA